MLQTSYQPLIGLIKELEIEIFSYLSLRDVARVQRVNKNWNSNVMKTMDRIWSKDPAQFNKTILLPDSALKKMLTKVDRARIKSVCIGCVNISDFVVQSIFKHLVDTKKPYSGLLQVGTLTNLKVLWLEDFGTLSEDESDQLFSHLTHLSFMHLFWTKPLRLEKHLTKMKNLRCFVFSPCSRQKEEVELAVIFESLAQLPKLTEVHLRSKALTDIKFAFNHLTACTSLKSLTIEQYAVYLEDFDVITRLTHETKLTLWGDDREKAPWLSKLTFLKSFEKHGFVLSNEDIITSLTGLEDLRLSLWGPSVEKIPHRMPHLTSLTFDYDLNNGNMQCLKDMTQLKLLRCATTHEDCLNEELKSLPASVSVKVEVVKPYYHPNDYLVDYATKFISE